MGIPERNKKYTYADYLTWPDEERWEIINGQVFDMSPAPKSKHQFISANLLTEIGLYLKGKKCKIVAAPFDVRLFDGLRMNDKDIHTIVQPDLSVFCKENVIDEKGAIGPPDLVIEILSESSRFKDLNIKLLLYQRHKIQEYWIVDPDTEMLYQYILEANGLYQIIKEYTKNDTIHPSLFPDLAINLKDIFE